MLFHMHQDNLSLTRKITHPIFWRCKPLCGEWIISKNIFEENDSFFTLITNHLKLWVTSTPRRSTDFKQQWWTLISKFNTKKELKCQRIFCQEQQSMKSMQSILSMKICQLCKDNVLNPKWLLNKSTKSWSTQPNELKIWRIPVSLTNLSCGRRYQLKTLGMHSQERCCLFQPN